MSDAIESTVNNGITDAEKVQVVQNDDNASLQKIIVEKVVQGSDELARARLASPPKPLGKRMVQLYFICLVGLLAGAFVGVDESILGGMLVLKPFQDEFGSSVAGVKAAYITAMFQIGSVCSIPFVGEALDRFGRRFGLFIGSLFVIVGVIVQGTSNRTGSLGQFLGGRFLLGFGSNIALSAGPTLVVEASHPEYRGVMTALQSSLQNFGGFIGGLTTFYSVNYSDSRAWLIPVWIQIIAPSIVALTVFLIPESPRWMYVNNKKEEAKAFLTKYHGEDDPNNAYVLLELAEFERDLNVDGSDKVWWDYRCLYNTRAARYRVMNNLVFITWGALSSGGISYYVGAFFQSANITNPKTVLMYNMGQNIQSFLASFLGSSLCDLVGRRPLLLTTLAGMSLSWMGVAVSTSQVLKGGINNAAAAKSGIAFYFIFSATYCIGITPLQGVYASEVLSYEQRAKGTAASKLFQNAMG